jgi:hypothetical protein
MELVEIEPGRPLQMGAQFIIVQLVNPEVAVPANNTLRPHIKHFAGLDRQLPEYQEESSCSSMIDGAKNSVDVS